MHVLHYVQLRCRAHYPNHNSMVRLARLLHNSTPPHHQPAIRQSHITECGGVRTFAVGSSCGGVRLGPRLQTMQGGQRSTAARNHCWRSAGNAAAGRHLTRTGMRIVAAGRCESLADRFGLQRHHQPVGGLSFGFAFLGRLASARRGWEICQWR